MDRRQFVCAMLMAGACAVPAEEQSGAAPGGPREGDRGTMLVRRHGRVQEAHYIVKRGLAMWQGDISLGPVPGGAGGDRSLALRDLDERWPHGIIDWVYGDSFSQANQLTILAAIRDYEDLTPLRFHHGIEPGRPYIAFYSYNEDDGTGGYTTGIGPDGTDDDDETDVNLNVHSPFSKRTVLHELGHALGLGHEQTRPDRDNAVSFREECTDGHEDQYDTEDWDDFEVFESYDLDSVMQYSSAGFCVKAIVPGQALAHGNCLCYPLVKKGFSHFAEGGFIAGGPELSPKDARGLYRMYERQLGSNEAGDDFGTATVSADFDNDGFTDLAIGAPGEGVDGAVKAGAVFLYKGTGAGLVSWRVIAESDIRSNAKAGDRFGEVLGAADFDQDGFDDLVVGAPHSNIWDVTDGGSVFVLMGTRSGPSGEVGNLQQINQTGFGAGTTDPGDLFGAAIATGDLDGDGRPDLAVGVPGEKRNGLRSGWVQVFTYRTSPNNSLMFDSGFGPPGTPDDGDGFGSALAISNFNNRGRRDLAVGAPARGSSTKAGAVHLFFNEDGTFTHQQTIRQSASGANEPAAGDEFGARLAAANFDGSVYVFTTDPTRQLVVGAPGKNNPTDSGRVFVFGPKYDAGFANVVGLTQIKMFSQSLAPSAATDVNDRFGDVLRVVDLDGDDRDDLLVGVPGENLGSVSNAGAVSAYHGTISGLTGWFTTSELVPSAGNRVGAALATGDFDRDGAREIIAGAPGRGAAGAVAVWLGVDSANFVVPFPVGIIDEESRSPE